MGPPLSANGPSRGSIGEVFGATLPTWLPSVLVMPLPVPLPIRLKRAEHEGELRLAVGGHVRPRRCAVLGHQAVQESEIRFVLLALAPLKDAAALLGWPSSVSPCCS